MFSYSEKVKSPEWRWQQRRADLRHFEIFRHEPIIIYTRLPAEGTYYPICTFPASIECLIGISDALIFCLFCLPSSCPRAHCTPNKSVPTLRYTLLSCCLTSTEARCLLGTGCATPAGMDLYILVHARRLLPSAVPLDFRRSSVIEWPPVRIGLLCTSSWLVERASGRVVSEEVLAGTEIPGGGGRGRLCLTLHCPH